MAKNRRVLAPATRDAHDNPRVLGVALLSSFLGLTVSAPFYFALAVSEWGDQASYRSNAVYSGSTIGALFFWVLVWALGTSYIGYVFSRTYADYNKPKPGTELAVLAIVALVMNLPVLFAGRIADSLLAPLIEVPWFVTLIVLFMTYPLYVLVERDVNADKRKQIRR